MKSVPVLQSSSNINGRLRLRPNYPDILLLLAVINIQSASIPASNVFSAKRKLRIDIKKETVGIPKKGLQFKAINSRLDSSLDVQSYVWNPVQISCDYVNEKAFTRIPDLLVCLTGGIKVLIEILAIDEIGHSVMDEASILRKLLPLHGYKYLIVLPSQFAKPMRRKDQS